MKNRKRFGLIAIIAVGSIFGTNEQAAHAQWQPVIRMGNCPYAYQPVCARSRKRALVTYANACAARSSLARIVSDGPCPDNCPPIYKPVCARDANGQRRTYVNACAAKNENALVTRNGRCLLPSS